MTGSFLKKKAARVSGYQAKEYQGPWISEHPKKTGLEMT
jgi:hypothetical protein